MQTQLSIVVDGEHLSTHTFYGDIEFVTAWSGGPDELSWSVAGKMPAALSRGGLLVEARTGPVPVFAGQLVEPDPSQDRIIASGAWHEADSAPALSSTGGAGTTVDNCIDRAITRGALTWTRPRSISSTATDIDTSGGPSPIGTLLDIWGENNGQRWGVDARRQVYANPDPTVPAYQTLPLEGSLGFALDNYASVLFCRYLDSGTLTYKTVTVPDPQAVHGYKEAVVDLSGRGPITSAKATSIGLSLFKLGRSTPQFTESIELSYGELFTLGSVPVALETVTAGQLVRVHGGTELGRRLNGGMYVDVLIGKTTLADGTLTLEPLNRATRTYQDFVTEVLSKKREK